MAYVTLASGDVDQDSPINASLVGDIKGNFDYLDDARKITHYVPSWVESPTSTVELDTVLISPREYTVLPSAGTPEILFGWVVPQNWDAASDIVFHFGYMMSAAEASKNIRIRVKVQTRSDGGAANGGTETDYLELIATANDALFHIRNSTVAVLVAGVQEGMSRGAPFIFRVSRDNTVGSNHSGDLRLGDIWITTNEA